MMTKIRKLVAASAMAVSAFAVLAVVGSGSAAAAVGQNPDNAYCLEGGGETGGTTPWCGYQTFAQCQQSASGIGADCVANAWRGSSDRHHSFELR
jgi:hypothetical protein